VVLIQVYAAFLAHMRSQLHHSQVKWHPESHMCLAQVRQACWSLSMPPWTSFHVLCLGVAGMRCPSPCWSSASSLVA
jgi:hypothetical protein